MIRKGLNIVRSQEVQMNRELALQEPEFYSIARTDYVFCTGSDGLCPKAIEVFAKDAPYTEWTCIDCQGEHNGN